MSPEIELIPPEEQVVRKKKEVEEKKPVEPIVPKIRKEPKIPIFIPEKERRAGIPIIPGDPCCAKICQTLNDTVDRKTDILDAITSLGIKYKSKTYRFVQYGKETLEDHRQELKDKGVCRCIEETGAVSIMVPLIRAVEVAKNGKLAIPSSAAAMLRVRPPETIREIHREEKSTIPTENSCCPNNCKILNNEIDTNNKILDDMELRGGSAVHKSPRYEALSYRTFHLQEYRNELKKIGNCKCIT